MYLVVTIGNTLQQGDILWVSDTFTPATDSKCIGLWKCILNRQKHHGNHIIIKDAFSNSANFFLNCTICTTCFWYLKNYMNDCSSLILLVRKPGYGGLPTTQAKYHLVLNLRKNDAMSKRMNCQIPHTVETISQMEMETQNLKYISVTDFKVPISFPWVRKACDILVSKQIFLDLMHREGYPRDSSTVVQYFSL